MKSKPKEPALHCRHDALMPVAELVERLHPDNPNTHPAAQLELYARIIRAQGWRRAVVLSKRSGKVVSGNGAVLASQAHGLTRCPIEWQPFKTEAEELAHLNADNELARLSAGDDKKLDALLKKLDTAGLARDLAGIIAKMEPDPDFAEVAAETQSRLDEKAKQLFTCPKCRHEFNA